MIIKKKLQKTSSSNISPIRGKWLWLLRVITAVVIPLFLFAVVELVLRLFNVGYETHAVIERK